MKRRRWARAWALLASGLALACAVYAIVRIGEVREDVDAPDSRLPSLEDTERLRGALGDVVRERGEERPEIAAFYRARGFEPAWTGPRSMTYDGLMLLRRLPGELGELARRAYVRAASSGDCIPCEVAVLEWSATASLYDLADVLAHGRADLLQELPGRHLHDERVDVASVLEDAAERGPAAVLDELERSHEERTGLLAALERYLSIQRAGGWSEVPVTEDLLERGTQSPTVVGLRARLAATFDLSDPSEPKMPELFDSEVERAVRAFQTRHGLAVDGRVGADTFAALNVSIEARIRQIRLNLLRRRSLPGTFGDEYVWVNVPEYRLYAIRGGEVVLDMKVIVGKPTTRTPSFADRLEYVVLNPYWNVPESIALHELLPRQENEPSYLPSRDYQVMNADGEAVPVERLSPEDLDDGTLRIRKRPGPRNDLGRIKFMMPNRHRVYLHDTPARHLFARARRAFSHGCIRLERPAAFGSYVLRMRMSTDELEREIRTSPTSKLLLDRTVPVFVVYFTAFTRNGRVHFREDVYGRDAAIADALERFGSGSSSGA